MNISVLAWFGHGNFGDELFMDAYRQLFPNDHLHFFTDAPNKSVPMINFDFVNTCDLFVLGGGELINQRRLFIAPEWQPKIKVPKIILGCGVNAKKDSQISLDVEHELAGFEYVGLRDMEAVRILSGLGSVRNRVGLFYDLAFSIDTAKVERNNSEERVAVVVPTDRHSNQADYGILQHNVAKKSRKWLEHRYLDWYDRVVFLPFGKEDNNDYQTCLDLARSLKTETEIIQDCTASKQLTLETIANATTVYAYRLHGLVLAKLFGRPYGFYPYHHKLQRVHDTVLGCAPSLIAVWQREALKQVLGRVLD